MGGMMKKVQEMQAKMQEMQKELENKTVEAESGGGMVKVTMNGKQVVQSINIDPSLLSEDEKEDRAQFAYEACWLSRESLVSMDVFEHFGWNAEDARQFQLSSEIMQTFQKLLFQRVMPNLKVSIIVYWMMYPMN